MCFLCFLSTFFLLITSIFPKTYYHFQGNLSFKRIITLFLVLLIYQNNKLTRRLRIFLTNKIFILLQRLKIKSHLIKIIFDFVRIIFDFVRIILVSVTIYIGIQTKNPHSKRMWTYMNNILVKIFSLRGLFQIRTGVNGFADRHLATRSRDHAVLRLQNYKVFRYYKNFSAFFYKKLLIILFGYSLYN